MYDANVGHGILHLEKKENDGSFIKIISNYECDSYIAIVYKCNCRFITNALHTLDKNRWNGIL